jgi:hypothetical protein
MHSDFFEGDMDRGLFYSPNYFPETSLSKQEIGVSMEDIACTRQFDIGLTLAEGKMLDGLKRHNYSYKIICRPLNLRIFCEKIK